MAAERRTGPGPRHPAACLALGLILALAPWLPAQATEYLAFLAYREVPGKPWQAPAVIRAKENPPDGDYAFQVVVTDPGEDLGIKPAPAGGWPKWVTLRGLFKVRTTSAGQDVIERANLDVKGTLTDAQLIGLPTDRPLWGSHEQWVFKVRPWLKPLIEAVETSRGNKDRGSPDLNVLRALMGESPAVELVADPNGTKNTFTLRRIHRLDPKDATYAKSIGQFWEPANPNTLEPAQILSNVADALKDQRGFWTAGYLGEPNRDHLEVLGFFSQFLSRTAIRSEDPKAAEATKTAEAAKAIPTWVMAIYIAIGLSVLGIASIAGFEAADWVKRNRPGWVRPGRALRRHSGDQDQIRSPLRHQDKALSWSAADDPRREPIREPSNADGRVLFVEQRLDQHDHRLRDLKDQLQALSRDLRTPSHGGDPFVNVDQLTNTVDQLTIRLDQSNREASRWREDMAAKIVRLRPEVEADIRAALQMQNDKMKAIVMKLNYDAQAIAKNNAPSHAEREAVAALAARVEALTDRLDNLPPPPDLRSDLGTLELRLAELEALAGRLTAEAVPGGPELEALSRRQAELTRVQEALVAELHGPQDPRYINDNQRENLREILRDAGVYAEETWTPLWKGRPTRQGAITQLLIHHPGLAGAKPAILGRLTRWIDLSSQGTLSLVVPTIGQPVDRTYHVAVTRDHQGRGQLGCVVAVRQLGLRMGKDCPLPAEVVESR